MGQQTHVSPPPISTNKWCTPITIHCMSVYLQKMSENPAYLSNGFPERASLSGVAAIPPSVSSFASMDPIVDMKRISNGKVGDGNVGCVVLGDKGRKGGQYTTRYRYTFQTFHLNASSNLTSVCKQCL